MEKTWVGSMASNTLTQAELNALDFLWIEITPKCNLNCSHCYVSSTPYLPLFGEMGFGDWIDVIDESFDCGCRKLQFIGGEPTLHPHLPDFIEHASNVGYEMIEIFTNGTTFSGDVRRAIAEHRVSLAFSVYGPQDHIHEQVTQRSGSLQKTIKSIQWALEVGLNVRTNIVEMPINKSAISETKTFLHDLGVETVRVDRVRGIGRGVDQAEDDDPFQELCGKCWQGKLCVTATGDFYPCIMAREFCVGQKSDGIRPVLNGSSLSSFREKQRQHVMTRGAWHQFADNCAPDEHCAPELCGPEEGCSPELCGPEK